MCSCINITKKENKALNMSNPLKIFRFIKGHVIRPDWHLPECQIIPRFIILKIHSQSGNIMFFINILVINCTHQIHNNEKNQQTVSQGHILIFGSCTSLPLVKIPDMLSFLIQPKKVNLLFNLFLKLFFNENEFVLPYVQYNQNLGDLWLSDQTNFAVFINKQILTCISHLMLILRMNQYYYIFK